MSRDISEAEAGREGTSGEAASMQAVILKEYDNLRAEIRGLKDCQVKYFWSSVTFTATLIGVGSRLTDPSSKLGYYLYLSPLLVVLPCWFVFFDKATSITRIVGYQKLLEGMMSRMGGKLWSRLDECTEMRVFEYVGWERALSLYRFRMRELKEEYTERHHWSERGWRRLCRGIRSACDGAKAVIGLAATTRYWALSWCTFFSLVVVTNVFAWRSVDEGGVIDYVLVGVFSTGSLFSIVYTLFLLGALARGFYSYIYSGIIWRALLDEEDVKAVRRRYLQGLEGAQSAIEKELGFCLSSTRKSGDGS